MEAVTVQLERTLKFLIVDDSRAIQAIIRRVIEGCGFAPLDVRTALDGEVALDLLDDFEPDLIITDWHMPKVSGIEMLQTLRQTGRTRMRVGFVTTENNNGAMEEARTNGALFVLNKPFKDEELIHAVRSAVREITINLKKAKVNPPSAVPRATPSKNPEATGPQTSTETAAETAAGDSAAESPSDNTPPAANQPTTTPLTAAPAADASPSSANNTPPTPHPSPAAPTGVKPMQQEALHAEFKTKFGAIPFKLSEVEALTVEQLSPQNLLGLYAVAGTKGIYAVALLDMNAVCMIGGGMARQNPTVVRGAMAAGQASPAMLENANTLLKAAANLIAQASRSDGKAVALTTSTMVKSSFAKLAEVLGKNLGRADFKLTIPGYGDGRLSFLLVAP